MLTTTLTGDAGALLNMIHTAVAGTHLNITELRHRRAPPNPPAPSVTCSQCEISAYASRVTRGVLGSFTQGRPCHVLWSVGVRNDAELLELLPRLRAGGFPTADISAVQAAQARRCLARRCIPSCSAFPLQAAPWGRSGCLSMLRRPLEPTCS